MADQSKLCSITNNSGKDVVVALMISDDETTSPNAVVSANQQFEILKTSAGNTVIENGSSDTVTLDHSFKAGSYVQDYDLIISDSTWLYPVADLPVVQEGTNGFASYAPQTVTTDSQSVINQALTFYQTVCSLPDSQLAKNYLTAIDTAKNTTLAKADDSPGSAQTVAGAIADIMNTFFKGTQDYQQLSFANVVAVNNYYRNFPVVWAQYKDDITYYLYGGDGTTAGFMGTFSLKKSGPLDVTMPGGGYVCTFMPAVAPTNMDKTDVDATKAVTLFYSNGLFLDDPRSIGLRGSFLLKRMFTTEPADNDIIPVITGNINGTACIGFDTPQKSTQQGAGGSGLVVAYFGQLTNPQLLNDWLISIMTFAGSALLIPAMVGAVYGVYRIARYKTQAKGTLSKQMVEDYLNKQNESVKQQDLEWAGTIEAEVAVYHDLTTTQVQGITNNSITSQILTSTFIVQTACVKELLKYSTSLSRDSNRKLQSILSSIHASELANIKAADKTIYKQPELLPERTAVLQQELVNLSGYQSGLDSIYEEIRDKISKDANALIDTSIDSITAFSVSLQNLMKREAEEEKEPAPKIKPLYF